MSKFLKTSFILLILFSCKPEDKTLPILNFKINAEGVKEYYTITYDGFVNQFNEDFTTDNLKDKVCIANFFFTRCPSICPPMRQELIKISDAVKEHNDFMMISHTIDMTNDTVDVLHTYWETTEVPAERWQFLRGSEGVAKEQAKQFMTNFKPNEDGTDFYHSSFVALIDKQQQIRGFYNTSTPVDMERLINDIKILVTNLE